MLARRWISLLVCAATGLLAACGSSTQKEPAVATAEPEPEPPPPPKPKPKCKSLEEKCEAKASTKAKIAKSDLIFTPPKGWIYAQGEVATVAQPSDDGPALAIAQLEVDSDPKKVVASREAAMEELFKEINVTLPPKTKINWKKAGDTKEVKNLKIELWQVNGSVRGETKGPLLIFLAPIEAGKELVGLGFLPSDDTSGADASILESIESIDEKANKDKSDKKEEKSDEEKSEK